MKNILDNKLEEIKQGKASVLKTIASLDEQREQAVANLNAFVGAEQVLLELIEQAKQDRSGAAPVESEDKIIEEASDNDAADND